MATSYPQVCEHVVTRRLTRSMFLGRALIGEAAMARATEHPRPCALIAKIEVPPRQPPLPPHPDLQMLGKPRHNREQRQQAEQDDGQRVSHDPPGFGQADSVARRRRGGG